MLYTKNCYHGRKIVEFYWYKVDIDGEIDIIKSSKPLAYKDILRDIYNKVECDIDSTSVKKALIKKHGIEKFNEKYVHRVKKAWIIASGHYYYED